MFGRFLPRETNYFEIFQRQAELIVRGAREFSQLCHRPDEIEQCAGLLHHTERQALTLKQGCVEALHLTFLTPIERDDIFQLTARIYDINKAFESAGSRIVLYKLQQIPSELGTLADLLVLITLELEKALFSLRSMENAPEIIDNCKQVQQLERQASVLLQSTVGKLFDEEPATRMVIKWKEIYDKIEKMLERCTSAAAIIEGIILEHV